jgi:hypothetical protein
MSNSMITRVLMIVWYDVPEEERMRMGWEGG